MKLELVFLRKNHFLRAYGCFIKVVFLSSILLSTSIEDFCMIGSFYHSMNDDVSEALLKMGYTREDVETSISNQKYDEIFATYLLLGRKSPSDVSVILHDLIPFVALKVFLNPLIVRKVLRNGSRKINW